MVQSRSRTRQSFVAKTTRKLGNFRYPSGQTGSFSYQRSISVYQRFKLCLPPCCLALNLMSEK